MFLVPEDLYLKMMRTTSPDMQRGKIAKKKSPKASRSKPSSPKVPSLPQLQDDDGGGGEDQEIVRSRHRMTALSARRVPLRDDERHIRYMREYKKYRKLLRDREERPVRVSFATDEIPPHIAQQPQQHAQFPGTQQQTTATKKRKKKKQKAIPEGSIDFRLSPLPTVQRESGEFPGEYDEEWEPATSASFLYQEPQTSTQRAQIMAHIRDNARRLHVSPDLKVLNASTGLPIATSDIARIIDYCVQQASGQGFGASMRQPPVGYSRFLQNIRNDEQLKALLGLTTSPSSSSTPAMAAGFENVTRRRTHQQQGKGMPMLMAIGKENKKTRRPSTITAFKPELW